MNTDPNIWLRHRFAKPMRAIAARPLLWLGLTAMLCVMAGTTIFYALTPAPIAPTITPEQANLDESQQLLAETIFRAQARGDFASADQWLARLSNPVLLGHILAQRYLDSAYAASGAELLAWLQRYADHPQAPRIRALALRKGVSPASLKEIAIDTTAPLQGDGYADHLGRQSMPDSFYSGLARWREKSYDAAFKQFAATAQRKKLSDWQKSAAHYWAYRSAHMLGRNRDAYRQLAAAGEFPVTFYGQLANQQRAHAALIAVMPEIPRKIAQNPAVLRARALVAAGQQVLAESELRRLVMMLNPTARPAVLAVAGELGLANLQVRLASLDALNDSEALYAKYPMPSWLLGAQSVIDPSLLLAVARQESVFRPDVKSHAGATGMMQMLPSTARHVVANLSRETITLASIDNAIPLAAQLHDPSVNVRLGAEYLSMLSTQPMVKGDLIRLIAAYNAGPGSVQSWQGAARNITDPLLYIESIPYPETRNYVMQVMAHQWVYQSLMNRPATSLVALAHGQWPKLQG